MPPVEYFVLYVAPFFLVSFCVFAPGTGTTEQNIFILVTSAGPAVTKLSLSDFYRKEKLTFGGCTLVATSDEPRSYSSILPSQGLENWESLF